MSVSSREGRENDAHLVITAVTSSSHFQSLSPEVNNRKNNSDLPPTPPSDKVCVCVCVSDLAFIVCGVKYLVITWILAQMSGSFADGKWVVHPNIRVGVCGAEMVPYVLVGVRLLLSATLRAAVVSRPLDEIQVVIHC